MKKAITYRKDIPLFYDKSEEEFAKDRYEQYDPMVIRQSSLHLIDDLWGNYPMQAVLDFGHTNWPSKTVQNIVEVGCSVGRWIAEIAMSNPDAECWGIDYSYQLLKQASDTWVKGKPSKVNLSRFGFSLSHNIQKSPISNLQFGLAKAEGLPFDDQSQDVVMSSFLFDRLEDPMQGIMEMYRILRPGGRIIMISPLNFLRVEHWHQYHPPIKLYHLMTNIGFKVIDWKEDLVTTEPLDIRGNAITWNSVGVVCEKG